MSSPLARWFHKLVVLLPCGILAWDFSSAEYLVPSARRKEHFATPARHNVAVREGSKNTSYHFQCLRRHPKPNFFYQTFSSSHLGHQPHLQQPQLHLGWRALLQMQLPVLEGGVPLAGHTAPATPSQIFQPMLCSRLNQASAYGWGQHLPKTCPPTSSEAEAWFKFQWGSHVCAPSVHLTS